MAAITWGSVLDQLGDEIPGLLWKFTGTATSGGATLTTTDPEINKLGSNAPPNRFQGRFLYIPSGTVGTDQVHSIVTISVSGATTTITTLGNYGATYTNAAMYLLSLHPDILRRLGNDALEIEKVECFVPLKHGPESGDMQGASVDADWTEANATDTVQTTASEVWVGAQSMVVTDSGSGGGYTQSALSGVGQGKRVKVHGILKSDTGTSKLDVLDGDGNIQASVETTQEWWTYLGKEVTFDAGDEQLRLRLTESSVSGSGDWQAAWFVRLDESNFRLPAWIDNRFRVKSLSRAIFHSAGAEADTWMADSIEYLSLREGEDYRFIKRGSDANPFMIWVKPEYLSHPLFLTVEAPYSAPYGVDATFSTDASTTLIEALVLVPRCKWLLADRYPVFAALKEGAAVTIDKRDEDRETAIPKLEVKVRRMFG